MRLAAGQLVRSQSPSGMFSYEFDFETGEAADSADLDGVALVRQSFAAYVLARYAARFYDQPALDAVRRFLEGAAGRSLPIGKGEFQSRLETTGVYNQRLLWLLMQEPLDLLGLLYSTRSTGRLLSADGSYELAYPGATALALAAGLFYQTASGDEQFAGLLRQWVEGLLAVQVPGRGFREAPHHLAESDYLNGEAWLALALYAEAYPQDSEIAGVLAALDDYMLTRYATGSSRQFYHWGSMASAQRAVMSGDERFDNFVASLTRRYLENNTPLPDETSNSCHVVEGLASFISRATSIRDADALVPRARDWIARLMAQNRLLQIDASMKSRLALDDRADQALVEFAGGFLSTVEPPRMRLDYTGHCLNAMLILGRAGLPGTNGDVAGLTGVTRHHQ